MYLFNHQGACDFEFFFLSNFFLMLKTQIEIKGLTASLNVNITEGILTFCALHKAGLLVLAFGI